MTIVAILNALPILVIGGLPALAGHILRRWGLRRRAAERFATNLD